MASPEFINKLVAAVNVRAEAGSDEAKLALGDSSNPNINNPSINGSPVPGSYPRGAGLGSDGTGSRVLQALLEGVADSLELLLPKRTVVTADLTNQNIIDWFDGSGLGLNTGPWSGWAICNGSNGTRDLRNKFIRAVGVASGEEGGSDSLTHSHTMANHTHNMANHTHNMQNHTHSFSHTHSTPSHQHATTFGFDTGSSLFNYADASGNPIYGSNVLTVRNKTGSAAVFANNTYQTTAQRLALTENSGSGTTTSQSTATTGGSSFSNTASPDNNTSDGPNNNTSDSTSLSTLPSYVGLTALMRL